MTDHEISSAVMDNISAVAVKRYSDTGRWLSCIVQVLSTLPALRELNLAFNYFTSISLKPEIIDFVFPLLEALDLGFNYVGNESDVVDLVLLDKLQRIILYGNPLVGPTGEDPLGLCVEGLIDKADRCKQARMKTTNKAANNGEKRTT